MSSIKPTSILLASLTAAVVTSAGVSMILRPPAPAPAPAAGGVSPEVWADLAATLEQIQAEQEAVAVSISELQMRSAGPSAERVPMDEIEAAVARYLSEEEAAEEVAPEVVARSESDESTAALFDQLLEGDWDTLEMQELWQRVRDEGRTDELLALFEARVEADPNDPENRVELGQAYLQKIQEVGNGPLAGVYATQADESFDAALQIDPEHWDARFNKAVALSFWPPIFGKQSAAIQQFEMLIAQQAQMNPVGSHAQSHLLLGNLYQQLGDRDKAIAAWQTGSSLFPDYQGLLDQLALAGQE